MRKFFRNILIKFLFSKKERVIIHEALVEYRSRCRTSLGESFSDTAQDITVIVGKIDKKAKRVAFLYDLE